MSAPVPSSGSAGAASSASASAPGDRPSSPDSSMCLASGALATAGPLLLSSLPLPPVDPASAACTSSSWTYCESSRVAAVLRYAIVDTDAEAQFDSITAAAAAICHTPASLISFLDRTHAWVKSATGFGTIRNVERPLTVCNMVLRTRDLFIVEDMSKDPRTSNNPMVCGGPLLRFYAGAPLIDTVSGQVMGSLCVLDYVPRQLNEMQRMSLSLLSRQVMAACESRSRIIQLQSSMQQLEETRNALAASKEHAERAQQQAEKALELAEQANKAKSEFLAVSGWLCAGLRGRGRDAFLCCCLLRDSRIGCHLLAASCHNAMFAPEYVARDPNVSGACCSPLPHCSLALAHSLLLGESRMSHCSLPLLLLPVCACAVH